MPARLNTPQIIRYRDTVTLHGVTYHLPTRAQIEAANRLTARQLALMDEFMAMTSTTEQGEGRKAQIQRLVAAADASKHRLLRMDVLHLLPDHLRKMVDQPFR